MVKRVFMNYRDTYMQYFKMFATVLFTNFGINTVIIGCLKNSHICSPQVTAVWGEGLSELSCARVGV